MTKLTDIIATAKNALRSRVCTQVNSDTGRYYTFQEMKLTSVTNYISNFFPFSPKKAIEMMKIAGTFEIKHPGKTGEQVMREWSLLGLKAAREGTEMHSLIEKFLVKDSQDPNSSIKYKKELQFAKNFIKDHQLEYVDGEVSIFDEDLGLAGTPDAIFIDREANFYLVDWKRSLKVLNNLDKHKLQTLTYANILYNKYNIKIKKCIVVGLHDTFKNYQAFEFDAFVTMNFDRTGNIEIPANKTVADLIPLLNYRIPEELTRYSLNRFLFKAVSSTCSSKIFKTTQVTKELLENDDIFWKKVIASSNLLKELIIKFNLNTNQRRENNETILHNLVKAKAKDSVEVVLKLGANVHLRCSQGFTPYKLCLLGECKDIFDLFVDYGKIDINGIYQNETPLTFSITNSLKEMFSHILIKGANPLKKNARGKNPLQLSIKKTDRFFSRKTMRYIQLHRRKS